MIVKNLCIRRFQSQNHIRIGRCKKAASNHEGMELAAVVLAAVVVLADAVFAEADGAAAVVVLDAVSAGGLHTLHAV